MRTVFIMLLLLCYSISIKANNPDDFKASGEPILKIYTNYHAGFTEADNNSVFEIERAYIGYRYKISPELSASIILDIGSPEDESVYALVKRYAYFKNAFIKYAKGNFSISAGIVGMNHFNVQEKFWGYRYIVKSFADQYKFGKSADLGILASYKLTDWFSADAAIVNGEGYSQLQEDSKFEYTAGATFKVPKNLTTRLFVNYGPSTSFTKMVYAFFLGYQLTPAFSLAAEYNLLTGYQYKQGRNQVGYSFYSTYEFLDDWKIFARYDILNSNTPADISVPWNLAKDGSALIAGVEKELYGHLKISLNYQDWFPLAANMPNSSYIFLNLEFDL
ncbi:MAG: outer membrane beta-barrel protein [Prolixibacteraceae bacterium]|nr:outer membrane beta-barrel protein [Prolixibacteraceae bacterium]